MEKNSFFAYLESISFPTDANVLITGVNGLLGSALVNALSDYLVNGKLIGVTTDYLRAYRSFQNIEIQLISWEEINKIEKIDFIFHLACPTRSKYFVEKPIETIDSIYSLTKLMLELANKCKAKMIYVSSMEVYGNLNQYSMVKENELGFVSLTSLRSSYPEAKRLAELLCKCYSAEKGVNVSIARLACVFGEGKQLDDNRLTHYVIQRIKNGEPIKLNTDGSSINNFIYLKDCINAIFYLSIRGISGETYNVANPDLTCSILDFCKIAINSCSKSFINISTDKSNKENSHYVNSFYKMDVGKISNLGFECKYNFEMAFNDILGDENEKD